MHDWNRKTRRLFAVVGMVVFAGGVAWGQPTQIVSFSPPAATFGDTITVQLAGAAAGQQIRYIVASGAEAATATVTSTSPVYSAPITLNITSIVRAAVFASGTAGGRATSGHYVKLSSGLAGFHSKLPVLVLDDLGFGPLEKDDVNHASWMYGYAPGGTSPFARAPDFTTPLVATVRGSSSAAFPKKGYNIRMRDTADRARAFPIFDLPAYERWALVAPWSFDATFINNAFMYELSNRIGRWAPRTRMVEVFFNATGDDLDMSDYAGIYIVTDRIRAEAGRVDVNKLATGDASEPAITGGYIFQLDPPGAGDVSWVTSRGVPEQRPSEIVLVEPGGEDATPAQLDYIKGYVQRMEDALHADRATGFAERTYLDYIDRSAWVDHHILNLLASNPDALRRSAYFTKPRGGRLQAGPLWDFDRALGGFWDERTSVVNTWLGVNAAVDPWRTGWWGVLADDPDFIQEWVDRWQSLRLGELSTAALTQRAQTLADGVGVEAVQRDVARWPDSASPQGSYPAQINYLKSWLTQRTTWIDSQFLAPPTVSEQGTTVTFTPPAGAVLAYTTNGLDPRMVGGAISPDTQMHAGELSVPAGTNIRVRSYDSTPRAQFPWSPWSSIPETVRASTAMAQGRLVNLSSKASLTAGGAPLIIGFVVRDAPSKRYLVRAVGPGLDAFGEPTTIDQPGLAVISASGAVLVRNSGWRDDPSAAELPGIATSVGAFPLAAGSADAAAIVPASSGNFTMQITSTTSEAGSVLGEIYEVDKVGRTANMSIRGRASMEEPLTAGFVIAGGANRVLIRGVGPTLRQFGVTDAIADPTIILRAGAVVIGNNDSWLGGANGRAVEEAGGQVGAFPLGPGSQDAALVMWLPAGNYTVEAKSTGAAGTVLLEVYELP